MSSRSGARSASGFMRMVRDGLGVALMLCAASEALASVMITYTAYDLPDLASGQDLWHYEYTLSGTLPAFNAVNILFPGDLYSDPAVTDESRGVFTFLTPPDPFFPADGLLNVTALTDIAGGSSESVGLDFVWLGAGTPGRQSYEVLSDFFDVIGAGQTSAVGAAVPEPDSTLLLVTALLMLLIFRRVPASCAASSLRFNQNEVPRP